MIEMSLSSLYFEPRAKDNCQRIRLTLFDTARILVQLDAWLGEGKSPYFKDSDGLIRWLDHCLPQHTYPPEVEDLRNACLSGRHPVAQDFFLAKVKSQMTLSRMKERISLISGILDICYDHLSGPSRRDTENGPSGDGVIPCVHFLI